MPITRDQVTRTVSRKPRRKNPIYIPTQRELSTAVIRLMEELAHGRSWIDPESVVESQDDIYAEAERSIMTANSALRAARLSVICLQWRRTKANAMGNVVEKYDEIVTAARRRDLNEEKPLLEKSISEADEGEAKTAFEKELRELLLRDATPGRPYRLGPKAMEYLTRAMIWWFRPVAGSPIEQEDLPRLVDEHTRFIDWLGMNILFNDKEKAAYQAAKDADKQARAAAGSSPAPEEEEGEETEEPAAQSA